MAAGSPRCHGGDSPALPVRNDADAATWRKDREPGHPETSALARPRRAGPSNECSGRPGIRSGCFDRLRRPPGRDPRGPLAATEAPASRRRQASCARHKPPGPGGRAERSVRSGGSRGDARLAETIEGRDRSLVLERRFRRPGPFRCASKDEYRKSAIEALTGDLKQRPQDGSRAATFEARTPGIGRSIPSGSSRPFSPRSACGRTRESTLATRRRVAVDFAGRLDAHGITCDRRSP